MANSTPTSATDKQQLIDMLQASRQCFVGSFSGVTDKQSRRHPAEGKWSVLDTVEHLTAAEGLMIKLISETRRPRTENAPNREEIFMRVLPDRSRKVESPDAGIPRGRFANLEVARVQFENARDQAIRFIEQSNEDLRATEVTHPHPLAGVVSTYEMLIVMAKHAERHAAQIDEIRAMLNCEL